MFNFVKKIPLMVWMLGLSILSGGLSGFFVSAGYFSPQLSLLEARVRARLEAPVGVVPEVRTVRVEPEQAAPVIPDIFLHDRRSPFLTIIPRAASGADNLDLTRPKILGGAVALTVDGWLLTSSQIFTSHRPDELALVWEGRSHPIIKAVKDLATGLTFIKIAAANLPASSLAPVNDIVVGLPLWLETRAGRVSPHVLIDTRERFPRGVVDSHQAARRYLMSSASTSPSGGPVWDNRGRLVGLVEFMQDSEAVLVPTWQAANILNYLIEHDDIRHASLGVRGYDTAERVSERSSLASGFLISAGRSQREPAIEQSSSAAKALKEGDLITRVEGDVLDGSADLGERLLSYRPGTYVTIYGQRAGLPLQVPLALESVLTSVVLK